MNRLPVFLIGFLTGGAIVFAIMFLYSLSTHSLKEQKKETLEEFIAKNEQAMEQQKRNNMQYIEVKGKDGEIILHTFMHKDSVKTLMGKPSRSDMMTIGTDNHETWTYEFPGEGLYEPARRLCIEFINGELESLSEL
ncbi:MAG: hypothetical protein NC201_02145 [Prevotella sp.]|nr:hypothetical protein [Bacteroides sp.]MCM1366028.1 hypothetical protein [Prevotella sp.]MCM1436902.1 hypothetical protein [Prevotella sp.]